MLTPMASDTAKTGAKADAAGGGEAPATVIKKYANRRLYNTATSSYVTLDDLSTMVKQGGEFVVYDAKSGEDITRSVLTQIIVEEEAKGEAMLPTNFLRQLIGLYGGNMQWLVPSYLEHAMSSFAHNQDQMRKSLQDAFGGMFPFGPLEQMGKQNLALLEKTMQMFTAFPVPGAGGGATGGAGEGGAPKPKDPASSLNDLKERINALQQQIEQMGKKPEK
jgi:polyhydroxyalkanoate synthesis repressor PhaR